jgi:hypothetical protein
MADEEVLTEDEARALLKRLSKHYKQPVKPIEEYCAALELWRGALDLRAERAKIALYPALGTKDWWQGPVGKAALDEYQQDQRRDFHAVARAEGRDLTKREDAILELHRLEEATSNVAHVFLQIRKSNLLWRLIYAGETLREQQCPVHKGHWSGCRWDKDNCACQSLQNGKVASDVTGWLP